MDLFFRSAILGFILIANISIAAGAEYQDLFKKADSLYQAKKYTEAFQLYEQLFQQKQASPAMLAKMAFIREGLGDYANALYYLNLYYSQTSDRKVLTKMRELAEKYSLIGYEYSDGVFIAGIIKKYKPHLLLSIFFLSLLMAIYIYRKRKSQEQPMFSGAFQAMLMISALVLINNFFINEYGIITQGNSVLMSGPSAGAEPVEIIGKGHKLKLLQSDEVWSTVVWNDEEVYIRSKNLKKI